MRQVCVAWRRRKAALALRSPANDNVECDNEDNEDKGGEYRNKEKSELACARSQGETLPFEFWQKGAYSCCCHFCFLLSDVNIHLEEIFYLEGEECLKWHQKCRSRDTSQITLIVSCIFTYSGVNLKWRRTTIRNTDENRIRTKIGSLQFAR